MDLIMTRS